MDDVELAQKLTSLDDRTKSNTHRIDDHEKEIEELKKTYAIMEKMDYRMENVEKTVDNINEKLDKHDQQIQEESTKSDKVKGLKWDKLIDYIFYAVLAYALLKLGLK